MYKKQLQTVSKRTKQLFLSSQLTLHGYVFTLNTDLKYEVKHMGYGAYSRVANGF